MLPSQVFQCIFCPLKRKKILKKSTHNNCKSLKKVAKQQTQFLPMLNHLRQFGVRFSSSLTSTHLVKTIHWNEPVSFLNTFLSPISPLGKGSKTAVFIEDRRRKTQKGSKFWLSGQKVNFFSFFWVIFERLN